MPLNKIRLVLFFATLIFVAKPFVGFNLRCQHYFVTHQQHTANILVKLFAKRKLEYSDESEFSINKIQKDLANPVLPALPLLAFALSFFINNLVYVAKNSTYSMLRAINLSSYLPQSLYLLSGKLTI